MNLILLYRKDSTSNSILEYSRRSTDGMIKFGAEERAFETSVITRTPVVRRIRGRKVLICVSVTYMCIGVLFYLDKYELY